MATIDRMPGRSRFQFRLGSMMVLIAIVAFFLASPQMTFALLEGLAYGLICWASVLFGLLVITAAFASPVLLVKWLWTRVARGKVKM